MSTKKATKMKGSFEVGSQVAVKHDSLKIDR